MFEQHNNSELTKIEKERMEQDIKFIMQGSPHAEDIPDQLSRLYSEDKIKSLQQVANTMITIGAGLYDSNKKAAIQQYLVLTEAALEKKRVRNLSNVIDEIVEMLKKGLPSVAAKITYQDYLSQKIPMKNKRDESIQELVTELHALQDSKPLTSNKLQAEVRKIDELVANVSGESELERGKGFFSKAGLGVKSDTTTLMVNVMKKIEDNLPPKQNVSQGLKKGS